MPFELDHPDVELPPGEAPLIVVAASTERDPGMRLIATALEALAEEPVRVLATVNRRGADYGRPVPANARVVDWLSYTQVLDRAAAMICHGGHGTVARALVAGVPVIVSPAAGEMAENGARVSWAGAGIMLPARLLAPAALRLTLRRLLGSRAYTDRARSIAGWGERHRGDVAAADLVEALAR